MIHLLGILPSNVLRNLYEILACIHICIYFSMIGRTANHLVKKLSLQLRKVLNEYQCHPLFKSLNTPNISLISNFQECSFM